MGHSRSAQPTIDPEEAPFFALLERLGRRVLRPGGRGATRRLLEGLGVGAGDDVVELAAGVGATASEVFTRLVRWPEARARVRRTRRVHRRHGALLAAIVVIACKPSVGIGAVSTGAASRP